ncbi:MAG: THUMP domain-containing protein [Candidatus Micrarchaeota archaeon]
MLMLKYSEPLLKGTMTRARLENILVENIRASLLSHGVKKYALAREGGVLLIEVKNEKRHLAHLSRVFGVNLLLSCEVVPARMEKIAEKCARAAQKFKKNSSFAIRARRVGSHTFSSEDIGRICGAAVQRARKLTVDLDEADNEIFVYVRHEKAYVSTHVIRGPGGLPLGSQGKALALISGGPRSLLAAWMLMRRGCRLVLLHAKTTAKNKKITRVAGELRKWHIGKNLKLYSLKIQREQLLAIADELARRTGARGIVVGDDLKGALSRGKTETPLFYPLVAFDDSEVKKMLEKAGVSMR